MRTQLSAVVFVGVVGFMRAAHADAPYMPVAMPGQPGMPPPAELDDATRAYVGLDVPVLPFLGTYGLGIAGHVLPWRISRRAAVGVAVELATIGPGNATSAQDAWFPQSLGYDIGAYATVQYVATAQDTDNIRLVLGLGIGANVVEPGSWSSDPMFTAGTGVEPALRPEVAIEVGRARIGFAFTLHPKSLVVGAPGGGSESDYPLHTLSISLTFRFAGQPM